MAHEQHVKIGKIVFLDHVVVLEREKRGPVSAFGQQQRRRFTELCRRGLAAMGERKSLAEPLAERPRHFGHSDGAVDALRRARLIGPARAALPAFAGECARVLGGELFRLCGKVSDRGLLDVVGRRLHELGLPARRRAFPAGKIKIGQREIGLERARRRVERRPRNTERFRLGPELLQPLLKTWIGCPRARERGDPHTYEDCRIATKSTHDRFPLRAKARLDPLPRSAATIQAGQALIKMPKAPKIWSRRCCKYRWRSPSTTSKVPIGRSSKSERGSPISKSST